MPKPLRVYAASLSEGMLELDNEASHYVTHVHRVKPGAALVLFDPDCGTEADATLIAAERRVRCQVHSLRRGTRPGLAGLQLVVARSKPRALEEVLRVAVASGVSRIIWVNSEHSVPAKEGRRFKPDRYRAILLDTARQCLRSDLPEISGPCSFSEALAESAGAMHCVLHPRDDAEPLARVFEQSGAVIDRAPGFALWIGPEGGFSDAEASSLVESSVRLARLGPFVLRVELAAAIALGCITTCWWARRSALDTSNE